MRSEARAASSQRCNQLLIPHPSSLDPLYSCSRMNLMRGLEPPGGARAVAKSEA